MNVSEQMQNEGDLENLLQNGVIIQLQNIHTHKRQPVKHTRQKFMLKAEVAQGTEDSCGGWADCLLQHTAPPALCGQGCASMGTTGLIFTEWDKCSLGNYKAAYK